jgi:hypothetical protein
MYTLVAITCPLRSCTHWLPLLIPSDHVHIGCHYLSPQIMYTLVALLVPSDHVHITCPLRSCTHYLSPQIMRAQFSPDEVRAWVSLADESMSPELYCFKLNGKKVEYFMEPLQGLLFLQYLSCFSLFPSQFFYMNFYCLLLNNTFPTISSSEIVSNKFGSNCTFFSSFFFLLSFTAVCFYA